MIRQTTFNLSAKRRGCHLVTQEILEHLPKPLPQFGMLNLFVQHTEETARRKTRTEIIPKKKKESLD